MLSKEFILGGTPVRNLLDFKYQALVQGIENRSYEYTLMGGAAIIAEHFALSAANIFLQQNGELRERRFYIGMGTRDLGVQGGLRLTVNRIYAPVFDPTFIYFNLVVVEVEGSFNFEQASMVAPARLPNVTDIFENLEAIASGFGMFEVNTESGALFDSVRGGRISNTLRYAKVAILEENACQKWYPANMTVMNMCGTIDSVVPVPLTGICYLKFGKIIENIYNCATKIFCSLFQGAKVIDHSAAVVALSEEAILGGTPTIETLNFTYQAVVYGLKNRSYEVTIIGGAAVLSEKFVLSAASVFLEKSGDLKQWRFSVGMGSHNLQDPLAYRVPITRIYVPVFDPSFIYSNLVVAELERTYVGGTWLILPVRLPDPYVTLEASEAVVSGFGYLDVDMSVEPISGVRYVRNGRCSKILRFANVEILEASVCKKWYPAEMTMVNMCATMKKIYDVPLTGICFGDIGGPLVVDNDLLIAIASSSTPDCDNTRVGALYMKVAPFVKRIKNFMTGHISLDAFIRENRIHIEPELF